MTWNADPIIFYVFNLPLRYYSLCWVLAFICGYTIVKHIIHKIKWPETILDPFLSYMIVGTCLGARLGHCLFYEFDYYSSHVLEIFLPIKITDSGILFQGFAGLASHGAAAGILVSTFLFSRKYKISWLEILDVLGIVVPIGGAFIRLGNFFNSEIVGKPTSSIFGIVFKQFDDIARHPAQLYEAFGYILITIVSYSIFNALVKKNLYWQKRGLLTGFSISSIFWVRFFLEYVKEPQNAYDLEILNSIGLNLGQLLSIPMIIGFSILMFWNLFKKNRT